MNANAVCEARNAKAEERIASLEEALEEAGIPHRKWAPDEGSGTHRPLPNPSGRRPVPKRPPEPPTEGAAQ
jgi:hypothetical protein